MSVQSTIEAVKSKMSLRKDKQRILDMFEGLVFSDKTHSYRFQQDDLVNVSTFTSKLTPPFNPEMANNVAKSKGSKGLPASPDYYTQRWAYKRDEAANRGSRVHLYAEQYPTLDNPEDSLEEGVCAFYDYMEELEYEVVLMELSMTDGILAGTCDLLLRHKITGKYVIADWKTNAKDIEAVNYYNKPLAIFNDIQDHDAGKFTIQTNLYRYLLENKGLEIEALWLIHLHEMHEANFKVINCPLIDINVMMQEGEPLHTRLLEVRSELAEKKAARDLAYKNKKWNN